MTNQNTQSDIITIALDKLDRDPKNVRKTYRKEGIEELACNIRADGFRLLQNIVVRKADKRGRFFVIAGERRRLALTLLAEAGEIARDFAVDARLRDEADATGISLAENVMREDMHPVDQYEAFKVLAEEGGSITDIAARFATTETIVRRRLALARVSPALLELYRNEEMSFEQLSAFTISDDHDEQLRVWESIPSWNRNSYTIKAALRRDAIAASDKRMRLIGGMEAYEQAGGEVKRDLFDERAQGYALDVALVERLAAAKLETLAADLRAEGWAWVDIRPEIDWRDLNGFGRVYPEQVEKTKAEEAELARLKEEHDELEAVVESGDGDEGAEARIAEIAARMGELDRESYSADDLARAGAIVSLDYNGSPVLHRGYVRLVEDDEDDADERQESGTLASEGEIGTGAANAPAAPALVHSATLIEDLTAQRTAALRLEFANNHHVALASVVHALLLQTVLTHSRDHTCLDIVLTSRSLEASMKAPATNLAIAGLAELAERFGDHVPSNPADIFEWCLERDQHELVELLAFAASHAIDAVKDKYDYRKTQRAHAEVLAQALDLDMTNYFEATAESYFNHLTRDGIEAALTDIKGPEFASGIGRMKKAEAAAYAEAQTKGSAWLPSPIRAAIAKTDTGKGSSAVAGVAHTTDEADDSVIDDADMIEDPDMVGFPEAAE
ncbi:ParB N-terminal domain-containing protein [Rhizobium rhizogenes]|uniref:Chromosome partitioning protein ParB n=1 Tax=Rhizobium rhizogenes TaxID=359 RepID=A0AA92BZJ5_RHIRH|nr:ParB N-terminal domain-containing protein [Rhizobium rhizogenes]PVE50192.1 chromosome partitioning protein ParB [Rhizobium rhizogenes]PVE62547.1 chromosome partitioning protein ParB [Agrobacterium tumefaciens]PVE70685.1 chromosome partitioning protein ParB [Sphingomonas sp. TPD3009]